MFTARFLTSAWRAMLVFSILQATVFVISPAAAFAEQTLRFNAFPPLQPTSVFGSAWSIYADGEIDEDSAGRLAQLARENHIPPGSMIFLNSPGGNLLAGMKLGSLIRSLGFLTYIGAQGTEIEASSGGGKLFKNKPGTCVSACALAFLGGSFRYLSKGVYGVHRFYAGAGDSLDSDDAQIISAVILQYIRDMGVDEALFAEMTQAGKNEMRILPESRLVALGVVNNGVGKTSWTIETAGNEGLYLKGHRATVYGEQKLLINCARKNHRLIIWAIFDPKGNANSITTMSAISLEIDGGSIRLPADRVVLKPQLMGGWINVIVGLDDPLTSRLMAAKTLGIELQLAFEAPVFFGIGGMDFTDGAKKLPGFLKSCPPVVGPLR